MTIIDSQAKRDHEFESAFLQRRVRCEPCGVGVRVMRDVSSVRPAWRLKLIGAFERPELDAD